MPGDYGFGEDETAKEGATRPRPQAIGPGAQLLVIADDSAQYFALPLTGEVLVGRAPECAVRIDHPSLSRRHGKLVMGATVRVEDLGSANGTVVRETPVSADRPAEVLPGDVIQMGALSMYVQVPREVAGRLRRVLPHAYFEARLEAECARAERLRSMLAVAHLYVGTAPDDSRIRNMLVERLRADEAAAQYAPGIYELLMTDITTDDAERRAEGLVQAAEELGVSKPRLGLALYPSDGRTPEGLIERASREARGAKDGSPGSVVCVAPEMKRLEQLIEKVAQGRISVLILGETGVGKEVTAEMIHRKSPRAAAPFVRLNCAALSEALIESELFGYEKGSFTGAETTKIGLLESAGGGTVFLDEVGELPMSTQVKLLRVLEERKVRRVGALEARPIDVRIVSATNRDIASEIEAARFRQDLYFRLNGVTVTVPPLRERVEEIKPLALMFVADVCEQDKRSRLPAIEADALQHLIEYGWPGNIRELRNVIERAVLLADDEDIRAEHLPLETMTAAVTETRARPATQRTFEIGPGDGRASTGTLLNEVQAFERQRIIDALSQNAGNQTHAAKSLGIARRTLIKRLDLYGIDRPRKNR